LIGAGSRSDAHTMSASATPHSHPHARIEWELLPSLRTAVRNRFRRAEPVWQETMTSAFEEVMPGLSVREVSEPEIFMLFFGRLEHGAAERRV